MTTFTESKDQAQARSAAKWRGHLLSGFKVLETGRTMHAVCHYCDAEVVVNSKPRANEINIGGEAVAVNCPG